MKKILVISSSLRHGSNSEALAQEFARGAKEAGHQVEFITLRGKEIKPCIGCASCQKTLRCTLHDDMAEITGKMNEADVIAFATPIYFYGLSGQLKTLLDRSYPLFSVAYKFRDVYLLMSATENNESTPQRTISGLMGWIVCYEKARLAGTVFAGGVTNPNDIQGHPSLRKAYEAGCAIR